MTHGTRFLSVLLLFISALVVVEIVLVFIIFFLLQVGGW